VALANNLKIHEVKRQQLKTASSSDMSSITFEYSVVQGDIYAQRTAIKKSFSFINGSEAHGCISLAESHIGGSVVFTGSIVGKEPEATAINATAARIGGSVILQPLPNEYTEKQTSKFKANGTVIFEGTIIKGVFECYEGFFNAPEKLALSLAGSRIDGYVSLINCGVIGIVSLNSARIGASITIENSRCLFSDRLFESLKEDEKDNYQGISLNIDDVQVDGHINIRYCVINEIVLLRCAQIGGHLDFSGSRFSSNFGRTLNADNIQVGGNITATDFKSAGSISLLDARIEGILNWQQGTEICCKKGVAFQADRIRSRGIYLRNGFKTDGEISILGAIIDGSLICTNGQFFDISAENVSVKGNVHLDQLSNSDNYFQSFGKVSLHNADIDGSLICTGGSFVDLSAPSMVVRGDVKLNGDAGAAKTFICSGTVRLNNAVISGNLDCIEGSFCNTSQKALVAEHILVKNVFIYNTCITGHSSFYGAKIDGVLRVENTYWGATSSLSLDQVAAKTLLEIKDSWPAKGNLSLLGAALFLQA